MKQIQADKSRMPPKRNCEPCLSLTRLMKKRWWSFEGVRIVGDGSGIHGPNEWKIQGHNSRMRRS